jgi:hypothetical protein
VTQRGNTTYVTYTSNGLPLTNLIRDFVPFGNVIADLTEPVLTQIVNSAYPNGNPIPADPSKYQPATPFSSLAQLAATATNTAATTGTAPKTTSAITAANATPDENAPATPEETRKPLTNVVRESEKAEPQPETDEGTSSSTSDPVATVDKPKKDENQKTADDEPKKNSGTDAKADES